MLGPSRSGKTTFLRAIAGLDPVVSGSVLIDGRDVTATPTQDRNVAMVFQASVLSSKPTPMARGSSAGAD